MPKEIVIKQEHLGERDILIYDRGSDIIELNQSSAEFSDVEYLHKSSIPALISALTELTKEK